MDHEAIKGEFENLAERFGIKIRCGPIKQDENLVITKGRCLLRGESVLIIDSEVAAIDKIRTLAEALRHFNLHRVYIKPVIRKLLDKVPPFKVKGSPSLLG